MLKVIPVAAYPINVCKFTSGELNELAQVIKRELRSKKMLGKQASDERLYLEREDGGREIKLLRDTYRETRVRVVCYMACSENRWISAAWRREKYKEENSIVEEATKTMENSGIGIQFEELRCVKVRVQNLMKNGIQNLICMHFNLLFCKNHHEILTVNVNHHC